MGCGVSRLDGYGMVLQAKFHPNKTFHYARPLRKELLLQDHVVEDEKYSSLGKNVPNIPIPAPAPKEKVNPEEHEEKNGEDCKKDVKEKRTERVIKTNDDEAETDGGDLTDDDADDERMIGHVDDDDEAFQGSPSFRVYFKDDIGEEKLNGHENDASVSSDEAKSSKECCEDKKEMKKRGRKKKSYSKNYKGVKNLLNYKSCYNTTPNSSGHDHANVIHTGKTSA